MKPRPSMHPARRLVTPNVSVDWRTRRSTNRAAASSLISRTAPAAVFSWPREKVSRPEASPRTRAVRVSGAAVSRRPSPAHGRGRGREEGSGRGEVEGEGRRVRCSRVPLIRPAHSPSARSRRTACRRSCPTGDPHMPVHVHGLGAPMAPHHLSVHATASSSERCCGGLAV